MWHDKKVSVILPTYNEKDSIRAFIKSLEALGIVDEIVVVNNNAAAGTSEEVKQTSAVEVFEPVQGYGAAMQKGLAVAKGDLLVVFEPDGTFFANDTWKLLSYSDDFDVVYGTRTSRVLIWNGANMGPFLKWGNYAVAKLMEILFNTTCLTDVGCTARCIRRSALAEIQPYFTVKGSFFGPEMMLLSFMKKQKAVQIAVNYTKRIGSSAVTGNKFVAFALGIKMINLILKCRFQTWFHCHPMQKEAKPRLVS
jgi:glycosyltransferase involved in cell wall biosynthesis